MRLIIFGQIGTQIPIANDPSIFTWETFAFNILASIVAAILFVLITSFFSKKARGLFVTIVAKLLSIDIEAIFKNKKESEDDVERELNRATYIFLFTGRGNELNRGFFSEYLSGTYQGKIKTIRIILPKLNLDNQEIDWIAFRESELSQTHKTFGNNILKKQIETNYEYLKGPLNDKKIELRCFNFPHVCRILITDSVIYLNPYPKDLNGKDNEIIKIKRGGPLYAHYKRVFEILWENSQEITV